MFNDASGFKKVYLATGFTDLRRGIDGLVAIVQFQFQLDPYDKNTVTIQYPFKVHFLFDFNYLSTVILTKRSKSVIRFFPVLC